MASKHFKICYLMLPKCKQFALNVDAWGEAESGIPPLCVVLMKHPKQTITIDDHRWKDLLRITGMPALLPRCYRQ
jgi:hypothetical protein